MSKTYKIKLYPQVISKIEYKVLNEDEFLKNENMIGYDEDNDSWVIGNMKYFLINLIEENKDIDFSKEQLNSDNINEILLTLYKSKNLNLKNQLVLYLDHIETHEYMIRSGIGTKMLNHLKELAKENNCKAIVLNAHPLIKYKDGIKRTINKTELNRRKSNLQSFYSKRGFLPINKKSDLMYFKI